MRDRIDEFEALGADVITIGMGQPEMAADFRDQQEIPFPVLVDHTKKTYRMLGLGRGSMVKIMGPQVWLRGAKGLLTGHGMATPKQDPYQLGGAVVLDKGGRVKHVHRATTSSDNLPVDDLLAALSK